MVIRCFENSDHMPPPRKILRRGTPELEDALIKGEVLLSLPPTTTNAPISSSWTGRDSSSWGESTNVSDETSMIGEEKVLKPFMTLERKNDSGETTDGGEKEDGECRSTTSSIHEDNASSIVYKIDTSKEGEEHDDDDDDDDDDIKAQKSSKSMSKEIISTKFSDIIGHGPVKLRLEEVLLPLALPPSLADSILTGVRSHSASILMYGPPGCGKTQLAKAVAGEAQAAFLSVGPSDILSKFVGESEQSIRNLFDKAREHARQMESKCAVLFFDEIDALGISRGGSGGTSHSENGGGVDGCTRRVLAELLIQMNCINDSSQSNNNNNGLQDREVFPSDLPSRETDNSISTVYGNDNDYDANTRVRMIVVAATNRPEDCDPALVRRFAVRVIVGLPSHRDRKRIVKRYLKGISNSLSQGQLQEVASMTDGWSGSDLESLTREAAMAPVRECIRSAARLKRRRPRQQKGISTSQDCHLSSQTDSQQEEHEKLLEQFRNLRDVTFEDFEEAISFWAVNHDLNTPPTSGRKIQRPLIGHYDSSSDEDE